MSQPFQPKLFARRELRIVRPNDPTMMNGRELREMWDEYERRHPPKPAPPVVTLAVVACAKLKRDGRAQARDLYTSTLFRYARAVAERTADRWVIVSALHNVLDPEQEIDRYERSLYKLDRRQRESWSAQVIDGLRRRAAPGSTIVFYAGALYREGVEHDMIRHGYQVEVPLRGLGYGEQVARLKARIASLKEGKE